MSHLFVHGWYSRLIVHGSVRTMLPLSFSSQVGEVAPQLMTCSMDIGLHRPQRDAHDFGDLLVRPAFHMTKYNGRAILGPESPDRPLQHAAQLAVSGIVVRALFVGNHGHRTGFGLGCATGMRRPFQ